MIIDDAANALFEHRAAEVDEQSEQLIGVKLSGP
jgi:hypothetical protein